MGMTQPEIAALFGDIKAVFPGAKLDTIHIEQENGKMALIKFSKEEVGEATNDFELLPAGKYTGQICNHDWKKTKTGGHMLALTLEITGPEYAGRKVFDNLNIDCDSEEAQKIALRSYKAICQACDVETFYDALFEVEADTTDYYLGEIPGNLYATDIALTIGVEKSKDPQYPDKNKIKSYGAVTQAEAKKPAPAAATKKPTWAK